MPVHLWFRRIATILPLTVLFCLPLAGCDDSEAPVLPSEIEIVTGNAQYSKRGTALPEPLRVRLRFGDGTPAAGYDVSFAVVELDGELSPSSDRTNDGGLAVTTLTLPDATGTVRVRASLAGSSDVYIDFTATSSDYYCPEEDPTFTRGFFDQGNLLLFTNKSGLHAEAGLVLIEWGSGEFDATSVLEFTPNASPVVPWDAAFSAAGDFFLAWTRVGDNVIEVIPGFSYDESGFATLDAYLGSEITTAPAGILIGCDEFGPFAVGCRDTLARFEGAQYGVGQGVANNDAVAVDPATDDVYYIVSDPGGSNGALMRLPMDGLAAEGAPVEVVALTSDEALGANGMVVDDANGSVYILVDTDDTKSIVKVTSAGVKSTEVDFFVERGAGETAGVQNDLAIDQRFSFLFTVDVLHGVLLVYDINQGMLVEQAPNTPATDPEALSKMSSLGQERVGLAVLP